MNSVHCLFIKRANVRENISAVHNKRLSVLSLSERVQSDVPFQKQLPIQAP